MLNIFYRNNPHYEPVNLQMKNLLDILNIRNDVVVIVRDFYEYVDWNEFYSNNDLLWLADRDFNECLIDWSQTSVDLTRSIPSAVIDLVGNLAKTGFATTQISIIEDNMPLKITVPIAELVVDKVGRIILVN